MALNYILQKLHILLILIILLANGSLSCKSDSDCIRPNMFCYETGVCANCTDCSIYKRLSNKGCAKTKDQCGDCMPGTKAEFNLDGTLQPCSVIELEEMVSESNSDVVQYIMMGILIAGLAILITAILICFALHFCPNWCGRRECFFCVKDICLFKMKNCCTKDEVDVTEKCGPLVLRPQEPSAPSAPGVKEEPSLPLTERLRRIVVDDTTQSAIASNNPCYVRNGHLDQQNQQNNEPAENDALMNEETMASSWTPTPNGEQQGPLNFQNALQLQQLHISQPSSHTVDSGSITSTDTTHAVLTASTSSLSITPGITSTNNHSPNQQNTPPHNSGQPISFTMPNNYDNNSNSSSSYSANSSNSVINFSVNVLANPTFNCNHT